MLNRLIVSKLLGICFFVGISQMAALGQSQQAARGLGLQNVELVVKLLSPISTKTSKKGDTFSAQVISPPAYQAAIVEGHITQVKTAKKREKARILFTFETMTLQGKTYPLEADLRDVANSQGVKEVDEEGHVIGRSSKKKQVAGALVGSAIGAALGGLLGGGKGAGAGAAAGAAAGLLIAIGFTTSGSNIEFAPGSTFTLVVSDRVVTASAN